MYIFIPISIYLHTVYAVFHTEKRKQKPGRFSLICLLCPHRPKGSLSFVCLRMKKQTEVIRLQTD